MKKSQNESAKHLELVIRAFPARPNFDELDTVPRLCGNNQKFSKRRWIMSTLYELGWGKINSLQPRYYLMIDMLTYLSCTLGGIEKNMK